MGSNILKLNLIFIDMEHLQQAVWANIWVSGDIQPFSGEMDIQMMHSDGTARSLLLYKNFGADIIRFAPWKGVGTHTHEGDHILVVLVGNGWVEYNWIDYDLKPWIAYMVPWSVPHAIKANSELVLMAIANDHRPAGSEERLRKII